MDAVERDAKIAESLAIYMPLLDREEFVLDEIFMHLVLSVAERRQRHSDGFRNPEIQLKTVDTQWFRTNLVANTGFQWIFDRFWVSCDEIYGSHFSKDDLDDIEVREAATILANLVKAPSEETLDAFDPVFNDEEACAAVIDRHPDLLALLKAARDAGDYTPVKNHVAIRRTKVKDSLRDRINELQPRLAALIESGKPFESWTPLADVECDPAIRSHIESLQIPAVDSDNPGILIDCVGRFSDDESLRRRVDGIFKKGAKTFLVNASGTGKTRLTFEGLCRHWGLYFILAPDTNQLGTNDIGPDVHTTIDLTIGYSDVLPNPDSPDFWRTLKKNIEIMDQRLSRPLLSRLLMFHMFSKIIKSLGITEEHKRLWLLFQLQPEVKAADHNYEIDVVSELGIRTSGLTNTEVGDLIAILFSKLRKIHGTDFHLFYVLDEAQVVSEPIPAFQRNGKPYSMLQEIIRAFGAKSRPQELSFVVAGTDIPKDGFANAPFADSIRWSSDTGAFDDEGEHRRYVSRFLTPTYVASPSGQMFLDRMWKWARGRHRTTDAILKALVRDGFSTPHRLLDDYIEIATMYRPTDYSDADEPFRYPNMDAIRTGRLPDITFIDAPLLKSSIQKVLFHYVTTAQDPSVFPVDLTPLVSEGIGCFTDGNMSQITFSEPMFVIAIAQAFFRPPSDYDSYYDSTQDPWLEDSLAVLTHHRPNITSQSLITFFAFYLSRAFESGSLLSEIFSFHEKQVPEWANQTGNLVASTMALYDGSSSLLTRASTLREVESWLDGLDGGRAPFCLTHTSDPDLLFNLKLADGRFIRVILHSVVADEDLGGTALEEVMQRLEDDQLLRDEEEPSAHHATTVTKLLDTSKAEGPFCVLRVAASFPGRAQVDTLASPPESSPIASLSNDLFKQLTAEIPPSELFEQIVKNVTASKLGKRKRPAVESPISKPPPKSARLEDPPKSPVPSLTSRKKKTTTG
ncbi:hypothetical protein R3P38DRAFT_2982776 [Favolaschia claudopus]|uniref:Uncharacterized protein n=1 Tax=Favolaschia claudopus TaxID=2862362 RepID=A0AAW0AYR1_9AGAR